MKIRWFWLIFSVLSGIAIWIVPFGSFGNDFIDSFIVLIKVLSNLASLNIVLYSLRVFWSEKDDELG